MPTMVYLTTGTILESGKRCEKNSWTDPNDDCGFFAELPEHLYVKNELSGQTNF